jgi:3-oxoacyl-[acyl-carrier-protein] synthase III
MAFLSIPHISIRGIAACVPKNIEENIDLGVFKEGEAERVIAQTGIERKRIADENTTTSDLCFRAANDLLDKLGWERNSVQLLLFASTTRDYISPQTSCILQDRLNLSEECITIDMPYGCPGWVIGLSNAMSFMQDGQIKRTLLLCGDTTSKMMSPLDKETRPLFGDAGSATALEFDAGAGNTEFQIGTRGKDYESIITPVGGFRHRVNEESLKYVTYGEHLVRRAIDQSMDGMNVFAFGISVAPRSIQSLLEKYELDMKTVDYWLFHQANQYMIEKIRKKVKADKEKTPSILKDFGNVSNASIPLLIVSKCSEAYRTRAVESIACAFGTGLAWGTVHFMTDRIVCLPLIEY